LRLVLQLQTALGMISHHFAGRAVPADEMHPLGRACGAYADIPPGAPGMDHYGVAPAQHGVLSCALAGAPPAIALVADGAAMAATSPTSQTRAVLGLCLRMWWRTFC